MRNSIVEHLQIKWQEMFFFHLFKRAEILKKQKNKKPDGLQTLFNMRENTSWILNEKQDFDFIIMLPLKLPATRHLALNVRKSCSFKKVKKVLNSFTVPWCR